MTGTNRRTFLKTLAAGTALGAGAAQVPAAPRPAARGFDEQADVVVVGLGAAGAAAAITAADRKASVIIVERQPLETLRSNTRLSGGYVHCPDKNGDKKALQGYFEALFSAAYDGLPSVGEQDEISVEMARYWTEITPHLVDWLQGLDPELKMLKTMGGAQYVNFPGARSCGYAVYRASYRDVVDNKTPTYQGPKSAATEGEALHRALLNGIGARRGIRILDNTRVQELVRDETGRVTGVRALRSGREVLIGAARGVALCCGGYEYSASMRRAFLAGRGVDGWAFYGTPYNEGDGIRMGLEVGAALTKAGSCAARMIWAPPVYAGGMRIGVTTNGIGAPGSIVANSLGRRFANELQITGGITNNCFYEKAAEQSLATLTYDNLPSWLVLDDEAFHARELANTTRSTVGYGFVDFKGNQDALARGWILKADSIEELAREIARLGEHSSRMKPEVLARTVAQFNDDCAAGKDQLFGRARSTLRPVARAPFYAVPLFAGGSNTKGGLSTTAAREVTDWSGRPIAGLYAAGEISCGLNRGGAMLTDCLVFGIVCGREMTRS